ncbi:MAG TPA: YccF domain-containing protein, partial [Polyangia bacterium]|nr:YccF domain-containing protein [Polyangia bacterium]
MSLLGNLLWLVFGGLLSGLGYILSGLLLCLTIVGIPFG